MKPICDKKSYANVVAGYITGVSAINTISGNYHMAFDEINELFGLNLPDDEEMLHHILEAFDYDIVAEVDTANDFDIVLYTSFCVHCNDDEDC